MCFDVDDLRDALVACVIHGGDGVLSAFGCSKGIGTIGVVYHDAACIVVLNNFDRLDAGCAVSRCDGDQTRFRAFGLVSDGNLADGRCSLVEFDSYFLCLRIIGSVRRSDGIGNNALLRRCKGVGAVGGLAVCHRRIDADIPDACIVSDCKGNILRFPIPFILRFNLESDNRIFGIRLGLTRKSKGAGELDVACVVNCLYPVITGSLRRKGIAAA